MNAKIKLFWALKKQKTTTVNSINWRCRFSKMISNKNYNNQRKNTNSEAESMIATGNVRTQAKRIFLIVPA